MKHLCSHCGEESPVVVCPVCDADISDLSYHSGPEYALADHVFVIGNDAHWQMLERRKELCNGA